MLFRMVYRWFLGVVLLGVVGCSPATNIVLDFDNDGSADSEDCAPGDPEIHPSANDPYGDRIDQNCDGVDGNAVDQDNDGYSNAVDCNDQDDSIHPDATDEFGDGIDQNCDDVDGMAVDQDGDGYSTAVDCDDGSPDVYPSALEDCSNGIDDDCDNDVDGDDSDCEVGDDDDSADDDDDSDVELPGDADGDGYVENDDCNDSDAAVNPGATEVCDLIDNDCDTLVDEDDAQGAPTWYMDNDGDGYGLESEASVACNQPHGYADYSGDCDDSDPTWHPGAQEPDCTDPNDYNCDGSVGYLDSDNDGFAACADCDDSNVFINPIAVEVCNSIDDDCDGQIDEPGAVGESAWYLDADGDSWGRANWSSTSCVAPAGFVANQDDCDDLDFSTNPGAAEVCDNGIDDNCNGLVDDGCTPALGIDADGDGFCTGAGICSDTSALPGDCDDANEFVYPGAPWRCDGQYNDCDLPGMDWRENDDDQDGFIPCTPLLSPHPVHVLGGNDCDDGPLSAQPGSTVDGENIYPGAVETCDSVDADCDGSLVDEFTDADGDDLPDCIDLCPTGDTGWTSNPLTDNDSDGCRDEGEDTDDDNDGVLDANDMAPYDPQVCGDLDSDTCDDCSTGFFDPASDGTDTDADGECDAGDDDDDNDGLQDVVEIVNGTDPTDPDTDDDGNLDGVDNCPLTANSNQNDLDNNGQGDACDDDDDGDGLLDVVEDVNGNGLVDGGETNPLNPDTDGDGILDGVDNCPLNANSNQIDSNSDGVGDACD